MAHAVLQHDVVEVTLGPAREDAWRHQVDVVSTGPDGSERRVPAFVGGGAWRARSASAVHCPARTTGC